MTGIVDIQLRHLERMLADRRITLDVSDEAKTWLANAGYDPVYGARPLKRTIQSALQNGLADAILRGHVRDGDTVKVGVGDGGLAIEVGERAEAA